MSERKTQRSTSSGVSKELITIIHPIFEACVSGNLDLVMENIENGISVNAKNSSSKFKLSLLHYASGYGRINIVRYLLSLGASPNITDENNMTPLHNAASFGHVEIIELLHDHGAIVDFKDFWGYTPLHEAVLKNKPSSCLCLVKKGADPNTISLQDKSPLQLSRDECKEVLTGNYKIEKLHDSIRTGGFKSVAFLLTPININLQASGGRQSTPLHLAAGYNRIKILKHLLAKGADFLAKDRGGLIPLHNACNYGHYEICRILLDPKNHPDPNDEAKIKSQIDIGDHYQFTPLHEATFKGREQVCSLLLSHGANPFLLNDDGQDAYSLARDAKLKDQIIFEFIGNSLCDYLHETTEDKVFKLIDGIYENYEDINSIMDYNRLKNSLYNTSYLDRFLLFAVISKTFKTKSGFNFDLFEYKNSVTGNTILHSLCDIPPSFHDKERIGSCRSRLIELIIMHRPEINIDVKNNIGLTARDIVRYYAGAKNFIAPIFDKMSIKSFPYTNQNDSQNSLIKTTISRKPLNQPSLLQYLYDFCRQGFLELVAQIISRVQEVSSPESVEHFINTGDEKGRESTALHFAAGYNRIKIAEFLIKNKARVDVQDNIGLIPLHNACSYGHTKMVKLLIRHGSDVNKPDHMGFTSLHEASLKKKLEVCRILIENGADISRINGHGKTPYDLWENPTTEVTNLLSSPSQLLIAARSGNLARIKALWNPSQRDCRDSQGRNSTPLHLAAGYNHIDIVEYLLENGANVNARDKGGLIPLHNACSYGHINIVTLLIKHNANVNAQDNWGFTPLHEASQKGRTQICSQLLSCGADPLKTNHDGKNPIDLATAEDIKALFHDIVVDKNDIPVISKPPQSDDVVSSSDISLLADLDGFNLWDFLGSLDLLHYFDLFEREKVTPSIIINMGDHDLKELGIEKFGDRHKILNHARKLSCEHGPDKTILLPIASSKAVTTLHRCDPSDVNYKFIEDMMQKTIRSHGPNKNTFSKYRILTIDMIENDKNLCEYKFRKKQIMEENNNFANEKLLFHGSPFINSIITKGFDERHANIGGMFGAGIYFADMSSKSNQYVFGIGGAGCPVHQNPDCYQCERSLLVCLVALGKTFVHYNSVKLAHAPPGHHSVTGAPGSGLNYSEYVIYRGEQARPRFVIRYRILPENYDETISERPDQLMGC